MKKYFLFILTVLIFAVAWWLVSPLWRNQTVNESLPFIQMTDAEYQDFLDAGEDVQVEIPSMDDVKTMTQEDMRALEQEMADAAAQKEDIEVTDEMLKGPTVIAQGTFEDADVFHKGSGSATLYDLPDGSKILRLEDFSVTNGPDLRVLLAVDNDPSQLVELGKLKGNLGDQNYDIDPMIDLSLYNSVIIYCKPFHVTFSTANLH